MNELPPTQTPNTQQNSYTPKEGGFADSLIKFIKFILLLLLIIVVLFASVFVLIIVFPENQLSKNLVSSTFLSNIVNFNKPQIDQKSGISFQESKPVNVLLGLEDESSVNQQSTVKLVAKTLPSVLSLRVSSATNTTFDSISEGTGFIISTSGLVITNKHVVSASCRDDQQITISGQDSQNNVYDLELKSLDPIEDIAILQIKNPPNGLAPVVIRDSNSLLLGEQVIAIGNALGQLNNTVTFGIVSGTDRTINSDLIDVCTGNTVFADGLIQTDAAINKGNSGGPLFDLGGQLIGMNTFGSTEAQNIGFAIPSSSIKYALSSYGENNKIIRPRLGIFSSAITPVDKQEFPWLPTDYGEIIVSPSSKLEAVAKDSSAFNAGLEEGDILLAINNEKIKATTKNQRPLRSLLLKYKPNEEIELLIRKRIQNGQTPKYSDTDTVIKLKLGSVSLD